MINDDRNKAEIANDYNGVRVASEETYALV